MTIWIIPVIIVAAVVVGLLVGTIVGKSRLKRSRPGYKPLFTMKEKLVYAALVLGGTALILIGAFAKFPSAAPVEPDNGVITFGEAPTETPLEKAAPVVTADVPVAAASVG